MSSQKSVVIMLTVIFLMSITTGACWGLSKNELREIQKTASDMNKGLPMMTSSEIQLTRVYLQGDNEFVYVLKTIIHNKNQLMPAEKLKPSAVNSLCTDPSTSKMIKRGLKYTYVFYDKANKYAYEYSITARDCGF